ncbi:MAG: DNA polymerase III subunit delta [Acidobacteriia bacterium]|nr:DNA polymerase III subunit delta [Terriglobia bacterium]
MAPLSPEQLLGRLVKGKPVPGILLLGGETYLRELCARKISDAYVPEGVRDWGVTRFSAAADSLSAILGQAQTLPMLAPRQVIFVSDVAAWERLGDDSRDALVIQLSAYLDNPAPFSVLVFEANALDKRMRLGKMFAEKTVVVAAELSNDPAERAKLAWALAFEMARELGVELERDAAEELSEIFNGDLAAIRTELEKLAAYVGDRRRVTRADVELLAVSARKYSVWELAEMLASRQPSLALEFLDSLLREGEQPAQLLGALAWMYRKLLEAQELPAGATGWQAASRLGMRPATAELAVRQSRKFPRTQLTRGLAALYEADSRLKSGGTSQRAVMEFLVAQLASSTLA